MLVSASSQQPAASSQQPAASSQQPAASSQQPFETLLDHFRSHARSPREQGAYFENLAKIYLENEPKWQAVYRKIWRYADWRKTHWDGGEQDNIGIDLVAETPAGAFHAMQCKFYQHKLRQEDLKQFPSSGGDYFSERYLITTGGWNRNVDDLILSMHGRLKTITRQDFEASCLDWAKYNPADGHIALQPQKKLRDYQQTALHAVIKGFETAERGKLIMACGTGKTFTALKIAEKQAGAGGNVLFLVPSLALLSQTLTEWTQQTQTIMTGFAVCSDIAVGRRQSRKDDDAIEYVLHEVAYPVTTKAADLAANFAAAQVQKPQAMRVIFSTYQSLAVIHEAQKLGLPAFDLIICDEAHRTTGQTNKAEADSNFVTIHESGYIHAAKRLYMTATPRIYKDAAKKAASEQDITLYSMDNERQFGRLFYSLSFSEAVHRKLLVDYKLIVLTIDEKTIKQRLQNLLLTEDNDIKADDAAKLIGCWKALAKKFRPYKPGKGQENEAEDQQPMRRAVAFAQTIDGKKDTVRSKSVAKDFPEIVRAYQQWQVANAAIEPPIKLAIEASHVDGGMNAQEKGEELQWLKEEPPVNTCRILSNVRCLSEGVDVPALDAVLFLSARNSQVDIVQSVGRVMRRSPGKKLGYVILPVVIPSGLPAEQVLADSKNWQSVWQVVNALRAHDPKIANSIARAEMGDFSGKIEICALADLSAPQAQSCAVERQRRSKAVGARHRPSAPEQGELAYEPSDLERGIIAMLVKRCGTRLYWPQWGEKIAKIGKKYRDSLEIILSNPANAQARGHFQAFLAELQHNLNGNIGREQALIMLAEQIIALPIFNALFGGDNFARHNPIAKALNRFLQAIQGFGVEKDGENLQELYEEITEQIGHLPDDGKQQVLKTVYETIIQAIEPENAKTVVYTPIEVIDFINAAAAHILKTEFGTDFNDKNVHVLEPFAGTGTFLARLIQSGAVAPAALPEFYHQRLWANEINLLAYYTACANIEAAYHAAKGGAYAPFPQMSWVDSFTQPTGRPERSQPAFNYNYFSANQNIIAAQNAAPLNVILGNPPYDSAETNIYAGGVDQRIKQTYAADSSVTLKNSLYDDYIRALRWASDRLRDKGIIAFITNSGFLEKPGMDGLRKHLAADFSSLYFVNLRGDIRKNMLSGGAAREGGNIFDVQVGIAIALLVKNPAAAEKGRIYYHNIGDGLNKAEKLARLKQDSFAALPFTRLRPDEYYDWLHQRDNNFSRFMPMGNKKAKGAPAIFTIYSNGIMTCRDAWAYNFSRGKIAQNMANMIACYNQSMARQAPIQDDTKIKWTMGLAAACQKGKRAEFKAANIVESNYSPFMREYLYYSRRFNEAVSLMPQIFPNLGGKTAENLVISVSGIGSRAGFSVFINHSLPCRDLIEKGQNFPLYYYEKQAKGGYRRQEAIGEAGLNYFRAAYPDEGAKITREDIFYYIYGLLHSPQYREKYKNNLMKELPHIPKVKSFADFQAFSAGGRALAALHLNFADFGSKTAEELAKSAGVALELSKGALSGADYRVEKMRYGGRLGDKDRSEIRYNSFISVKNIPAAAYGYIINGRSAIDWVVDRQQIKRDKASGIVNDPNDYARELGDPAYPLKLLLNIIRLSRETQTIIAALPELPDRTEKR